MLVETIDLKQRFPKLPKSTEMVAYIPKVPFDRETKVIRQTVVICPGGGYEFTSAREAEPIALSYNAAGMNAVVVYYSVHKDNVYFPTQLAEACGAIAIVREHAQEWNADPDQIYVSGFSAGGHLAGSVGTLWNLPAVSELLELPSEQLRPNGMILAYPVLTSDKSFAHWGSIEALLGDRVNDPAALEQVCLEKQVGAHTPPAYIWHTFTDTCVPVRNSLEFARAMQAAGVPFEMHIFPDGWHGLSLSSPITGDFVPEVAQWMEESVDWMRRLWKKK